MIYARLATVFGLATTVAGASTYDTTQASTTSGSTCREIKHAYQDSSCCNSNLEMETNYIVSPSPPPPMDFGTNPCDGKKPSSVAYFNNVNCTKPDGILDVFEQAGANVTAGYVGGMSAAGTPITTPYWQAGLCPVNVHWHLGAEHLSVGEFDEHGVGPQTAPDSNVRRLYGGRRLGAAPITQGFQCHHYDASDAKFTTEYNWQHCTDMVVGQTYEVHWPHSQAGACGTVHQYQSPFYDGVFCVDGIIDLTNTASTVGVQSQVFTVVNDEHYYYPDLMRGMIVDGDFGADIAKYTGSTTGTSRDNTVCSRYTPITWQVDRKCHLISASSFDKLCSDMKAQPDDMSIDLHAHGARMLVAHHLAADNLQRQRK